MKSAPVLDPLLFSQLEHATTFYLLRHGESVANAQLRIQGRSEYPLSDNGRRQALAAAGFFPRGQVSAVFCSPQTRARQTAEIVCSAGDLPQPQDMPELMELDTGCFTGLTFDEVRQSYPDLFAAFQIHSWAAVPDAESIASLMSRASSVWAKLVQAAVRHKGNVLAITHGGLIQWLVRLTFGCSSWMPLLTTGNCGLFELKVMPHGPGLSPNLHWKELNRLPSDDTTRTPPVF